MSTLKQDSLDYHAQGRPGKLKITATKPMENGDTLSDRAGVEQQACGHEQTLECGGCARPLMDRVFQP